jgi:hypothetical protein
MAAARPARTIGDSPTTNTRILSSAGSFKAPPVASVVSLIANTWS